MIANLETSKRFAQPNRYRFYCTACQKIGRFSQEKTTAQKQRDEHNQRYHS